MKQLIGKSRRQILLPSLSLAMLRSAARAAPVPLAQPLTPMPGPAHEELPVPPQEPAKPSLEPEVMLGEGKEKGVIPPVQHPLPWEGAIGLLLSGGPGEGTQPWMCSRSRYGCSYARARLRKRVLGGTGGCEVFKAWKACGPCSPAPPLLPKCSLRQHLDLQPRLFSLRENTLLQSNVCCLLFCTALEQLPESSFQGKNQ